MAQEVFSRYEKKYILNSQQYDAVTEALAGRVTMDPFNRENGLYDICNIYYDTADDLLIRHSLAKPPFKEKLRLRSYGTPEPDAVSFLELKKKYRGKVYKRRTKIRLNEAGSFAVDHVRPYDTGICNRQVLDEIEFFTHRYRLLPTVYIAYERMAFGQGDLRITFDRNIITRRHSLALEYGIFGDRLIPEDTWIMEIKVFSSMPLWLSHLLAEQQLYTKSFSKYGREYMHYISSAEEFPYAISGSAGTAVTQLQQKGA